MLIIPGLPHGGPMVSSTEPLGAQFSLRYARFAAGTAHADDHHRDANDEHRKRQFLSPRERPKIQTNLHVRLTNEFNQETEDAIETQQSPKDRTTIEILLI